MEIYELTYILDQPIYFIKKEFELTEKKYLAIFQNELDRNVRNAKNELVFENLLQALSKKIGSLIVASQFDFFYTDNLLPASLPNFQLAIFFETLPSQIGWDISIEMYQSEVSKEKTYLKLPTLTEIEKEQNKKLASWAILSQIFSSFFDK